MKRRSFLAWLGLAPAAGWLGAKLAKPKKGVLLDASEASGPVTACTTTCCTGGSDMEIASRSGHIVFRKDENGELVPPDISAEIARVAKARGVKL